MPFNKFKVGDQVGIVTDGTHEQIVGKIHSLSEDRSIYYIAGYTGGMYLRNGSELTPISDEEAMLWKLESYAI